jgi:SRSO17 transposase
MEMSEGEGIIERFEQYLQLLAPVFGHADRENPAAWYLKGLLSDLPRKSVEPMAALVHRENVRSAHQSMHNLVAVADWGDAELLSVVTRAVIPKLAAGTKDRYWIIDDTAHPKKGTRSVGVARQWCGRLGKEENCQDAVTLSFASDRGSIPMGYRLYLGHEWTDNWARCAAAGVPDHVRFQTKGQIARDLISAATLQGVPRGIVLGDASYGVETDLRDGLRKERFDYALAVRKSTTVWWGKFQPAPEPPQDHGHPRMRLLRDESHQPVAVGELARLLPPESWETITWREGAGGGTLYSRFARVRARAAHENQRRPEEWLLIEWPDRADEPAHFWLATFPEKISFKELVRHAKARWRIERDYQELKSEIGLSHYEGRNWRGFHHHAALCIAAYGFLILEGLDSKKKSELNYKNLPYPEISVQGALGRMQRHVPWSVPTIRRDFAAATRAALETTSTQPPAVVLQAA